MAGDVTFSRRRFLAATTGGLALAATRGLPAGAAALAGPGSLPDPSRPAGVPDPRIPIDHVVVVMMENHSFDNYFGLLPRRGQPAADGFRFDASGRPADTNPAPGGVIRAFHMPTTCQPEGQVNQTWTGTRISIDGGRMDGFIEASQGAAMGYWDDSDIPFYYSLGRTFTLANRWFASVTGQTYPNRRYLMAATSYGLISTVLPGVNDPPPPNGTIFDRLNAHGITWTNYFTDLPQTAIIPSVVKSNLTIKTAATPAGHYATTAQFLLDAAAGTLPNVAFVDPEFGAVDAVGGVLPSGLQTLVPTSVRAQGGDEENPQNITFGESFVASIVHAVMASPLWPRTLLVWTYDEHGGWYDHVPPPAAVLPDTIPPDLAPTDVPGRFDLYGCRVPAVVVSPWSKPAAVTGVVHDHTSILKFIEEKWNLPAITYRDANAASLGDFLDFSRPRMLEPPALAGAPVLLPCDAGNQNPAVSAVATGPEPSSGPGPGAAGSGAAGSGAAGSGAVGSAELPPTGWSPGVAGVTGIAAVLAGTVGLAARRGVGRAEDGRSEGGHCGAPHGAPQTAPSRDPQPDPGRSSGGR